MKISPKWVTHFVCPKCRGRNCITEEITLSRLTEKLMMRGNDKNYLLVTCGLCGYTEMYSMSVLASIKEEVEEPQTQPAIEKIK